LIADFGTHYVSNASMGAYTATRSDFEENAFDRFDDAGFKVDVAASYSFSGGYDVRGNYMNDTQKKEMNTYRNEMSTEKKLLLAQFWSTPQRHT
jgi:hypothetical protein